MQGYLFAPALAGALLSASGALAADADARKVVNDFTAQNVRTIAIAGGNQAEILADGSVGIAAPDGVKLIAQMAACQNGQQDCKGLTIFVMFEGTVAPDVLSRFNMKHVFTSTFTDGARTYLARNEICDYGISVGNIAASIANVDGTVPLFKDFVKSSGIGASATPATGAQPIGSAFADTKPPTQVVIPMPGQKSWINQFDK